MKGKKYQQWKVKIFPSLSLCLYMVPLSILPYQQQKTHLTVNIEHSDEWKYTISGSSTLYPSKWSFTFWEERNLEAVCQNILSLTTLICITFVHLKQFMSWEFFPKQYMN